MPSGLIHLPASSVVPVAFDAFGAMGLDLQGFSPSATATNTHTCTGANRAVTVLAAGVNNGFGAAGQTYAAVYGGVAMTPLAAVPDSSGGTIFAALFGLLNPPTGPQTWSATVSGGGSTGRSLIAYPQSYVNVGSFGAVSTNFGPGASPSLTVVSAANEMIVQVFEAQGAFTAYNQTLRAGAQASGVNTRIEGGDAPGGASVNFAATAGAGPFAGAAVRLLPV